MKKYLLSITVNIRPSETNFHSIFGEGLTVEYKSALRMDGTVKDAAEVASQFEELAKRIIQERG